MAKKAKSKTADAPGKNLQKLTKAGVIPRGYKRLSPAERAAIETLTAGEVSAIKAAKTKLGRRFFKKHASHGMLY